MEMLSHVGCLLLYCKQVSFFKFPDVSCQVGETYMSENDAYC